MALRHFRVLQLAVGLLTANAWRIRVEYLRGTSILQRCLLLSDPCDALEDDTKPSRDAAFIARLDGPQYSQTALET